MIDQEGRADHSIIPQDVVKPFLAVFEPGHPKYDKAKAALPTLADLRMALGGDEGEMTDPMLGQKHRISLKRWAGADPERTYVLLTFRPTPPDSAEHPWRQPFKTNTNGHFGGGSAASSPGEQ